MEYCRNYSSILCPHCKKSHDLEPYDVPWCDDVSQEHKCSYCREDFIIKADATVTWTTHKNEDDD